MKSGEYFEKVELIIHFKRRNFNEVAEAEATWKVGTAQRSLVLNALFSPAVYKVWVTN